MPPLNIGGVERLSAAKLLRVLFLGAAAPAVVSFLSLLAFPLLLELDSSMPRRPRNASRHLHLQQRRFDVVVAVVDVVAASADNALLLRLRQQLLPLLDEAAEKEEEHT